MRIAVDSRKSSTVSGSLITKFAFRCSGTSVRMVGILISVWIIASIPYVIANGDIPVGLRVVVLEA